MIGFRGIGMKGQKTRSPRAGWMHAASGSEAMSETGAGEGNRTLVISLEGFCSTIELHPLAWRYLDGLRREANMPRGGMPCSGMEPCVREGCKNRVKVVQPELTGLGNEPTRTGRL